MSNNFDELAEGLAQFATRRATRKQFGVGLAGTVLVSLFAVQGHAADLYADASVTANGDGSGARPYWRITDAVEHARVLRQIAAIPVSERIVIHVAAGTYLGSKETPVLNHNPRYEALPILLNAPNLTLAGSTVLTTDARGLPVGMVPGTETLLATEDNYTDTGKSLILLSRSTDGGVGDDVTVSGFHLDSLNGHPQSGAAIRLDRVSRFAIYQNLITRGGFGLYATRASGSVEGNLITGGFSGVVAKGGSREHPSEYFIARNRRVAGLSSGFVIEADGLAPQIDVGANQLELEPLPVAEVRDDPPFTTEATVVGNECSDNGGTGMKCFMYSPPIKPLNPLVSSGTVVPRLTVMASGNTFSRNRTYGVVVDANDALRSINHPLTADFTGVFLNNTLVDNRPAAAVFTFTAVAVSLGNASLKDIKYLQQATYDITDLDGELVGYDYDNPVIDPFDGTVLNNTLIVNGTVIPPGTKITP